MSSDSGFTLREMRTVKVREVAGSVVISLPRPLLAATGLRVGDQVTVIAYGETRALVVRKA